MRASRSITRTAVNGSPASASIGGRIDGSGRPSGAGRSGPRPMVPVAVSGTGTSTPSEPLGISDCTTPPFGGRANEPSSGRNPRATRTRHAWRTMLPNELAQEPVVPTPPPPAPAKRRAVAPPPRPGDRPPHCRHLRRGGRGRTFRAGGRRPGSARCQSECGGRPDRRRRRRLRAGPRGVGPAPREVRRSRHARRPRARLRRDRRPGRTPSAIPVTPTS